MVNLSELQSRKQIFLVSRNIVNVPKSVRDTGVQVEGSVSLFLES